MSNMPERKRHLRKIAVIMSLYKNDKVEYVRMAVESILNQSFRDFEFYIQYDGPVREEVDRFLSSLRMTVSLSTDVRRIRVWPSRSMIYWLLSCLRGMNT